MFEPDETKDELKRDLEKNSEQLNNLSARAANPAKDFFDFIYDLLKTGIIVLILAFLLRYFVIQPYIVDGESMMPNYFDKEYLLAEKVSYLFSSPQRGDVVVFRYPLNQNLNYIKRIIGLPGETVKIANDQVTIINAEHPTGFVLSENYIPADFKTEPSNGSEMSVTLKDNEYFVLGDNRQHSSDSRDWGILPKMNIAGRAWLTLLPLNRFGIHHRVNYPGLSLVTTEEMALLQF